MTQLCLLLLQRILAAIAVVQAAATAKISAVVKVPRLSGSSASIRLAEL